MKANVKSNFKRDKKMKGLSFRDLVQKGEKK